MDHEGEVLEAVASTSRDTRSTSKLLKKLMKHYGRPHAVVTDRLASYCAAMREIGNARRQACKGRRINNQVENFHQPFRRRERAMPRFRHLRTLQKFVAIHGMVLSKQIGLGRASG